MSPSSATALIRPTSIWWSSSRDRAPSSAASAPSNCCRRTSWKAFTCRRGSSARTKAMSCFQLSTRSRCSSGRRRLGEPPACLRVGHHRQRPFPAGRAVRPAQPGGAQVQAGQHLVALDHRRSQAAPRSAPPRAAPPRWPRRARRPAPDRTAWVTLAGLARGQRLVEHLLGARHQRRIGRRWRGRRGRWRVGAGRGQQQGRGGETTPRGAGGSRGHTTAVRGPWDRFPSQSALTE